MGIGWLASGLAALIFGDRPRFASLTDLRLVGPRTGRRLTNTQPMCGTGFPPTKRPSSNSHLCVP